MKKNKYNFPRRATNSNNPVYNQYVEDVYFSEDYNGKFQPDEKENTPRWKNNGRMDIFHTPYDNTDCHDDPYTVAQHYIDRTRRPHG